MTNVKFLLFYKMLYFILNLHLSSNIDAVLQGLTGFLYILRVYWYITLLGYKFKKYTSKKAVYFKYYLYSFDRFYKNMFSNNIPTPQIQRKTLYTVETHKSLQKNFQKTVTI